MNVKIEEIIDSYLFEVIPRKHVFIVTYGCNLIGDFFPKISYEHQGIGLHSISDLQNINIPVSYARSILN